MELPHQNRTFQTLLGQHNLALYCWSVPEPTSEEERASSPDAGFDEVVGANIRRYRTARGMSQADLAEAMDVHQQTIQKIEKGVRPLRYSEAIAIARVLEIPSYMLLDGHRTGAANSALLSVTSQLDRQREALTELAAGLGNQLVDLALIIAAIDQSWTDEDDEGKRAAQMKAVGGTWLSFNWGKHLNRGIMTALHRHSYLSDIRTEFESPTYLEVLQKLKGIEIPPVHPSQSAMAPLEILKWRRLEDDESET